MAINPNRLQWCMSTAELDVESLAKKVKVAKETLESAMQAKEALTINQLEKIAKYFNQSLLFFIEPNDVIEERIYSPQFRTINNQRPITSSKLRAFIENVEKQREVYASLLEAIGEPPIDWEPDIPANTDNIKIISGYVREWLNISISDNFKEIRQALEDKGIMVIVSNGYNGKWQIEKDSPICGFSLYHDVLPIIVVKKQVNNEPRQAFTLMHELAHLILHKSSFIDNEKNLYSYRGKEKDANDFAGNLLIPDIFLDEIDINELLNLNTSEYSSYLNNYRKKYCVSVDTILVRLSRNKKIPQEIYQNYRDYVDKKIKPGKDGITKSIPRRYRYREPINIFGKNFVCTVLNNLYSKNITLVKASTYLDNLTLDKLRELKKYV